MKTSVKKKWISALLSGKYKQGKGRLKTRGGNYCCLGVLCDIYHKETGKGNWSKVGSNWRFETPNEWHDTVLPEDVRDWAGLDFANPNADEGLSLAEFNDGNGVPRKNFEQIAEIIKKL